MRRTRRFRYKGLLATSIVVPLIALTGCQERSPTALVDGQLPEEPLTVEVVLPWSDFGTDFQVLGGYGSVASIGSPVIAHTFAGTLEARTLVRFGTFPTTVRFTDDEGVTQVDTELTYVAGHLVLAFDTLASIHAGPVSLQLGALQEEWDTRTASWAFAVDTVADQRPWAEAGAGPVIPMGVATWDPAGGDSVSFGIDSTSLSYWVDATDPARGGRIEVTTDGVQLQLTRVRLRVDLRPASSPTTLVEDTVRFMEGTVVYDPPPPAPVGLRVGGAPAWRSVMGVVPPSLTGPPELCAVVSCPYTPTAGEISYAALSLTSTATEPGYEPADTVRIDVRSVLSPSALPKSPLGVSQTGGLGTSVAPELFSTMAGSEVDVPITTFLRTLLAGPDASGNEPPSTLALTSVAEPLSLSYASFFGPADSEPPVLKLILTVGSVQALP